MYQKRFSLHRKPFQSVLHDGDFFRSQSFEEISPLILHALRSDLGVAVLTGPAGVGKSVSLDAIRRQIEPASQIVFLRGGAARTSDELLYGLHRRLLKVDSGGGDATNGKSNTVRRWDVVERLQRVSDFWGPLVLLLDDAHLLQAEVFSELRSLLEEEVQGQKLLRLLIAGPLVLEEVLAQTDMSDFAQKIRTHVFLQPLRTPEAVGYLKHEMQIAGGSMGDVFDSGAIEKIVAAADGIPRCLNLLADESLMVCEETDQLRVTTAVVNQALSRLQHLPIAWNAAPDCEVDDDEDFSAIEDPHDIDQSSGRSGPAVESSSVVEIGGGGSVAVARDVSESEGVVEFGASPSERVVESGIEICNAAELSDSDSVVEFVVANSTSTPVAESTDSTMPAAECGALEFGSEPAAESISPIVEVAAASDDDAREHDDVEDATVNDACVSEKTEPGEPEIDATCSADLGHHLLLAFAGQTECSNANSCELEYADELDSVDALDFAEDLEEAEELDCAEELDSEEERNYATDQNDEVDFEDIEAEDFKAEECELEDFRTDVDGLSEAAVEFGEYSRWKPAGEWPAEPISTFDESAAASSPVAEYAAQDVREANRNPVFDRYTWCELGRAVSPDQTMRQFALPHLEHAAVWPPQTAGVAPVATIPVIDLEPQIAEQLDDIGVMVEAAGTSSAFERYDRNDAALTAVPDDSVGGRSGSPYDSYPEVPRDDPDMTIDQIQEMLHSEMFEASPTDSQIEQPTDSLVDDADDATTVDQLPSWVGDEVFDELSAADEFPIMPLADGSASEATGEVEELTTAETEYTICSEHVNDYKAEAAVDVPLLNKGDDGPQPLPGSIQPISTHETVVDQPDPNGPVAGGVTELTEIKEVVEALLLETAQEAEEESEGARIYHPALLQEARSRVISLLSESSGLRMAAGAESVSFPLVSAETGSEVECSGADEVSELENDLALAELETDEEVAVSDSDDEFGEDQGGEVLSLDRRPAGRSRFSDLFTKLRRLKNG